MSPEVLKLRAFRQTSVIFLKAQKKNKNSPFQPLKLAVACLDE
jgi:hypothetical protein